MSRGERKAMIRRDQPGLSLSRQCVASTSCFCSIRFTARARWFVSCDEKVFASGVTLVTSNLPFDEWTEVFGSERLTGALLDRLTHHVHILEMNGDSYRLNQSQNRQKPPKST